jgi:hypothetical protein
VGCYLDDPTGDSLADYTLLEGRGEKLREKGQDIE